MNFNPDARVCSTKGFFDAHLSAHVGPGWPYLAPKQLIREGKLITHELHWLWTAMLLSPPGGGWPDSGEWVGGAN